MKTFLSLVAVLCLSSSEVIGEGPIVEELIGTWEMRPQYGRKGPTAGIQVTYKSDGTGLMSISHLEPNSDLISFAENGRMLGTFDWAAHGREIQTTNYKWQNKLEGFSVTGGEHTILSLKPTYFVLESKERGDFTVRCKKTENLKANKLNDSSIAINEEYTLRGDELFECEADNSYQAAGRPAMIEWLDKETGFFNYLLAFHIEYFKPGDVFIARGSPTLIVGRVQTQCSKLVGTALLPIDDDHLMEKESKVSVLANREPGTRLQFRASK